MCGFYYVCWCVCVDFVMCVGLCMRGFCDVCCVYVWILLCGCVYVCIFNVWVCVCVDFVIVLVCMCGFFMFGCVLSVDFVMFGCVYVWIL